LRYFRRLQSYFTHKSSEIKLFEKRIQYKFFNTYYLEKALTHRSVKNHIEGNYERLEFLGDAIIDHVVSYWLFNNYSQSDEGALTKKRAALVNREFLAMLGNNLKLTKMVKIDSGVNINDEKVANNISADVYEAIVGAIYLDGGYKEAEKFINRTLCLSEHLATEDRNYKGQLIEYCHSQNYPTPLFEIVESHGPEHERTFMVKVSIDEKKNWIGIGSTKKSAEQDGAQRAINHLLGS
jgi:ribonuclease-3